MSVLKGVASGSSGDIVTSFETISKNLKAYPATLFYSGGVLISISYITPDGYISKTLGYINNILTTITLSGDIPDGIDLIKTLSYTNGTITGVSYS